MCIKAEGMEALLKEVEMDVVYLLDRINKKKRYVKCRRVKDNEIEIKFRVLRVVTIK